MAMQPEVRYINAYVSGTAAPQPVKKPQNRPAVYLPKVKKQQNLLIISISFYIFRYHFSKDFIIYIKIFFK